jgi:diacylglycerol kinase family enzyme
MLSAEHTVSIKSKRSVLVQVDGDVIGKTPVEIEVLPGALTVLVPDERITMANP